MQLKLALLRLTGLLCALGGPRLNCQETRAIAKEVIVAPFSSPSGRIENCESISDFENSQKARGTGHYSQLKQKFSVCTAQDVPYGEYKVRGNSGARSFEGTCTIGSAHAVCTPVIPFDSMDWFGVGQSTVLFELDQRNVSGTRFWLNVKPLFYGAWPGRGPGVHAYPSAADITTGFDDSGHTTISLPHLSQFVITVIREGKPVASAPFELQYQATGHSYRLTIGDSGCLSISPDTHPLIDPAPR